MLTLKGLFSTSFILLICSTGAQGGSAQNSISNQSAKVVLKIIIPEVPEFGNNGKLRMLFTEMPALFKLSLQDGRFSWLRITSDTIQYKDMVVFSVKPIITEIGKKLLMEFALDSVGHDGKRQHVDNFVYEITPDSILVYCDQAAKQIAWRLNESQELPSKRMVSSLIIFPYEIEKTKLWNEKTGRNFAESIEDGLQNSPEMTDVAIGLSENEKLEKAAPIVLKLNGSIKKSGKDSLSVLTRIFDSESNKLVFSLTRIIVDKNLLYASEAIVTELKTFLLVYPAIRVQFKGNRNAESLCKAAEAYYADTADSKRWTKAQVLYRFALQIDSGYAPAMLKVADAAAWDLKYEEAKKLYRKVIFLSPDAAGAYTGLGDIALYERDTLAATQWYQRAIEKCGGIIMLDTVSCALAFRKSGEIQAARGDYETAFHLLDRSIMSNKKDLSAWYSKANTYWLKASGTSVKTLSDTVDYKLAYETIDTAMKYVFDSTCDRNRAFILNAWANCYYQAALKDSIGKELSHQLLDAAYQKYLKASRIKHYDNGVTLTSLNWLTCLSIMASNLDTAKYWSEKAILFESADDDYSYRTFGWLFANDTAKRIKVLSSLKKANALFPREMTYQTIGEIYFTEKNLDSAYQAFQTAVYYHHGENYNDSTLFYLYSIAKDPKCNAARISEVLYYLKTALNKEFSLTYLLWARALAEKTKNIGMLQEIANDALKNAKKDKIQIASIIKQISAYYADLGDTVEAFQRIKQGLKKDKTSDTLASALWNIESHKQVQVRKELILLYKNQAKSLKNASVHLNLALLHAKDNDSAQSSQEFAKVRATLGTYYDTLNLLYYQTMASYSMLFIAYTVTHDTIAGLRHAHNVIGYGDRFVTNDTISNENNKKLRSNILNVLILVLHEYEIDMKRSYNYSLKLLALDTTDIDYRCNAIEGMLTAENYADAMEHALSTLRNDGTSASALKYDEKLVMRFIYISAASLSNENPKALMEWSNFRRDYENRPATGSFNWTFNGTKIFLTQKSIDTARGLLLLKMIDIMERAPAKSERLDRIETALMLFCNKVGHVSIGTGLPGGLYCIAGSAISNIINCAPGCAFKASFENTLGSSENIAKLRKNAIQVALCQSDILQKAGKGDSLRLLVSLYDETITLLASGKSGIASMADLKSKRKRMRVNIGPVGSGSAQNALDILNAFDIDTSNCTVFYYEVSEARDKILHDSLDAIFYTVGHPVELFSDIDQSGNDFHLIPLNGPKIETLLKGKFKSFHAIKLTSALYPHLIGPKGIWTIGCKANLVTNAAMDDSTASIIVKNVFSGLKLLQESNPAFKNLTPKGLVPVSSGSIHPAALRYFREKGYL